MNPWPMERLARVAEFRGGGTPATDVESYWGGNIPWVSPKDMKSHLIGSSADTITEEALKNSAANLIPAGSILAVVRSGILAHSFPTALTTRDVAVNQDIKALCPSPKIDAKFMHYMLRAMVPSVLKQVTRSATVHRLSTDVLRNLLIPCPPLAEQRRIAAILDEAFAGIATATANAEKNLANARLIPSAGLAEMSFGVDKTVQSARLGDLVTRLTNGFVGPIAKVYVEVGIPYLLARHVKDDRLNFDSRTYITDEFNAKCAKSILRAGDVLLVQSGHIGHSAVVPPEHEGHNCHAMIVISPTEKLRGTYLSAYFNSRMGRLATQKIRSGSTVPHLTCKAVRELMIPVPGIRQQDALIERHAALKAESARLVDAQLRKLALLAELKQSILHRAYNGDLSPAEALAA